MEDHLGVLNTKGPPGLYQGVPKLVQIVEASTLHTLSLS